MLWTQESVNAEVEYRSELARHARDGRRGTRPVRAGGSDHRLRRWMHRRLDAYGPRRRLSRAA